MTELRFILGSAGYLGQGLIEMFSSSSESIDIVAVDIASADNVVDLTSAEATYRVINERVSSGAFSKVSVVNCATHTVFTDTLERTPEEVSAVLMANIGTTVNALNALVRVCLANNIPGVAVNVSSIFSTNVPHFENYKHLARQSAEIYGASKAGVEQLTRYYAKKYGRQQIRVNCVAPGGLLNPEIHSHKFQGSYGNSTATGKMTQIHEVGEAIGFLLSDRSSGITGVTLRVDGGYGL